MELIVRPFVSGLVIDAGNRTLRPLSVTKSTIPGVAGPSVTVSTGVPSTVCSASFTRPGPPFTYMTWHEAERSALAIRRMTMGLAPTCWPATARSSTDPNGSLPTTQMLNGPACVSGPAGQSTNGANL